MYTYIAEISIMWAERFYQQQLVSPYYWTNNWTTLVTLSIRHRFSSIFGFSVVGSKVLFSSYFKKAIWKIACIELFWYSSIVIFLFYFTSLFFYIIIFLLSFSFQTTCSKLAKTILQLVIQTLKITKPKLI